MENQSLTPQIFEHSHFGKLRVLLVDGVPYFVGKDVANSLGYKNTSEAVRNHVGKRDKRQEKILTTRGAQKAFLINKSGVYSLVLDSQLPLAKEYRHWVTSVVLPKIDEQGFFIRQDIDAEENFSLAEKLITIAAQISDTTTKDKILTHAANLLVGHQLF